MDNLSATIHRQISWESKIPEPLIGGYFLMMQSEVLAVCIGIEKATPARPGGPLLREIVVFLFFSLTHLLLVLIGVAASLSHREWKLSVTQCVVPVAMATYMFWPEARYDAIRMTHLIGKHPDAVRMELGTRDRRTGTMTYGGPSLNFWRSHGLNVIFDCDHDDRQHAPSCRVIAI